MKLVRFFTLGLAVSLAGLVACSSDDDGTTSSASSTSPGGCAEAKKVADECNAKPWDGGAKLSVKFDEAKCESSGDQGKKAADCIVAHRDDCDCLLSCSLTGSCSK